MRTFEAQGERFDYDAWKKAQQRPLEQVMSQAHGVRMEVTAELQHLCPFKEEVDLGRVTIGWDVDGWTLELHSLRAWLDRFQNLRISHEDLNNYLTDCLQDFGLPGVTVTSKWDTAGMEVRCSTSPTPVGQP